ncbi:hypothetical protein [Sphingobium sp. CAP-1]|uniref:hypothetical protein n=1 Tax=Sphingobium sp. CAP-1 TaxID=2676077 RepID=UPI0012BB412B|nr:hypothetical protein [Sphingobium sp. CAP-1]QGP78190.1 hypothetical protein GL174_03650 [Sphingobium sp. CAP-1]
MVMPRNCWLLLPVLLGACSDEAPEGQVVARVNGVDVTRRELMTELRAQGDIAATDLKAVQGATVQRLIDRKLLVAAAREALVDRSPDYQAERRRMEEMLLASQLSGRLAGRIAEPDAAAIDHYIVTNPHMFAQRQNLLIERLDFDPRAIEVVPQLGKLPSLDTMAAVLSRAGIAFHRQEMTLDTRMVSSARAQQLSQWLVGRPVMIGGGVQTLVARRILPGNAGEQRRAARDALLRQAQAEALAALARRLRRGAMISYQPGFMPAEMR